MCRKYFLLLAGVIFLGVGLAHVIRLLFHLPIVVNGWAVPWWISYLGIPVTLVLSIWGLRLFAREGKG